MKKFLPSLQASPLFHGLDAPEIETMLACLGAKIRDYPAKATLFAPGQQNLPLALLLAGEAHIQCLDYWGNQSLLSHLAPGDVFGEAYTLDGGVFPNQVTAATPCTVLFLNVAQVLSACPQACPYHTRLMHNLFGLMAQKNRYLVQKLEHLSQRSTREKLLSYLSACARQAHSNSFSIPFNRQQLADFLAVNRSALSVELSRMQAEGLLTFHKNQFTLN